MAKEKKFSLTPDSRFCIKAAVLSSVFFTASISIISHYKQNLTREDIEKANDDIAENCPNAPQLKPYGHLKKVYSVVSTHVNPYWYSTNTVTVNGELDDGTAFTFECEGHTNTNPTPTLP